MTLNLRESCLKVLFLHWKPLDTALVGQSPPQAALGGTLGEVILAGPELASVVTGLRPV